MKTDGQHAADMVLLAACEIWLERAGYQVSQETIAHVEKWIAEQKAKAAAPIPLPDRHRRLPLE
jgi:hypothetical protein